MELKQIVKGLFAPKPALPLEGLADIMKTIQSSLKAEGADVRFETASSTERNMVYNIIDEDSGKKLSDMIVYLNKEGDVKKITSNDFFIHGGGRSAYLEYSVGVEKKRDAYIRIHVEELKKKIGKRRQFAARDQRVKDAMEQG